MPNLSKIVRSKQRATRFRKKTPKQKPMPNEDTYNYVLAQLGDEVATIANRGEITAIFIRPERSGNDWIIRAACLGFAKSPDKKFVSQVRKLCKSPEEWEFWD